MESGAALAPITCSNPDCRVAETRRCVEGLEPDTCPRYGRLPVAITIADQEPAAPSIGLPLADALDIRDAELVLGIAESRVIAIVGPNEAGKTSLLAGVYDQFQTGAVGALMFSRSRTLQAFELVCHDARVESKRGTPHSERTKVGEVKFYHLEVNDGASLTELVIADRSGEEYREMTADVSHVAGLPEVARADKITLLVDGCQLADTAARHNARANTLLMLQALSDGGMLGRLPQSLAVVLTKLDAIVDSPNAAKAKSDFNRLVGDIQRRFGKHFIDVTPFEVAASPKSAAVPRGEGLHGLIAFWARPLPPIQPIVQPTYKNPRTFGRLPLDEGSE